MTAVLVVAAVLITSGSVLLYVAGRQLTDDEERAS